MNHSDITLAQPAAWSILSRSVKAGKAASTYLFSGQEGLGHWSLALHFAALLNCLELVETGDSKQPLAPCQQCRHCRTIYDLNFEGLHVVLPIPSHKNIGEAIDLTNEKIAEKKEEPFRRLTSATPASIPISMAREISGRLSRKGTEGITRVVVFYRMEKMKTASADALLKLIEEPPPDTVIILTASRPEMLLPTIQSRSQKIRLSRTPEDFTVDYLRKNYELSESKATLVARLSDGVLGKAIEIVGASEDEGIQGRAVAMSLYRSLFLDSSPETVGMICDQVNPRDRGGSEEILRLWQSFIRDSHYLAVSDGSDDITNVDFVDDLHDISRFFRNSDLAGAMVSSIKNTLADLGLNVHIQTAFAALSLRLKKAIEAA